MSKQMEIRTQTLDSSSRTIELRFGEEPEMDAPVTETSADQLTLRSVEERLKQGNKPIFRQVGELCAL